MSEFRLYYELGLEHILDINGYDHILFIIALCAIYLIEEWKQILILVTAFTIGHSVTLALSTLDILSTDKDLIEFLIPVTILITALANIFVKSTNPSPGRTKLNYVFAAVFGLVHGLGFSNYLKSLLGRDTSIVTQLFAFNIGLEVGQIIIVGIFMIGAFLSVTIFGVSRKDWKLVISAAVAGIAFTLVQETMYW
ncbi:MAG: HupE/UreJ family protein [Cyclobacteriaceae bacterium]|jgi:hypothetical protein